NKMKTFKWQRSLQMPVAAPLEIVWEIVSDYYELLKWFPGVTSCERVEGAPLQGVGCIRRCTVPSPPERDGMELWADEKLVAMDATNHSYTYVITDTNMDWFQDYKAILQVVEGEEEGKCLIKWNLQLRELMPGHSEQDVTAFFSSKLSSIVKKLEEIASAKKQS
ncbi:hypothetical protein KI387_012183, partial [Taxus chinensis]